MYACTFDPPPLCVCGDLIQVVDEVARQLYSHPLVADLYAHRFARCAARCRSAASIFFSAMSIA
jgi:hypothetical protein